MNTVKGARWAVAAAGIKRRAASDGKKQASLDVALLELAAGSTVAAVFTQNAFCAAPVHIARAHLAASSGQQAVYCLVNSGNANAGTGNRGLRAAEQSCQGLAAVCACDAEQVLPFSTGVIGELLPVDKIQRVFPALVESLSPNNWDAAARAIMTTDTVPKLASRRIEVNGAAVNLCGITKGAGMIKPNMATMLAYIVTDAAVAADTLQALLNRAVGKSFNRITVDGDTSTNDACLLAATGGSGVSLDVDSPAWPAFEDAVCDVMQELAMAIIRDAEGATKFITLDVCGGGSTEECLVVAYAVAESPLVKTAFFASDANWGRILAAVGRAGVKNLDAERVTIALDGYTICENGGRADAYDEQRATQIMARPELVITINLGRGSHAERVWTSDLSHDYVRINAEYRT